VSLQSSEAFSRLLHGRRELRRSLACTNIIENGPVRYVVSLLFRGKISKWLFRQCIHHDLGLLSGANSLLFVAPRNGVVHDALLRLALGGEQ
jgi:hypothetical protein